MAGFDWVLSKDAAALEAYRACGYPPIVMTFYRAVLVAVKAHDPAAQCVINSCDLKIDKLLQDLDDQEKLPKC